MKSTRNSRLLEYWQAFLDNRDRTTARFYAQDLNQLMTFLELDDAGDVLEHLIQAGERSANLLLEQFKQDRLAAGEAAATINRRLSSVRSFFRCLREAKVIRWQLTCTNVLDPRSPRLRDPFARRRR